MGRKFFSISIVLVLFAMASVSLILAQTRTRPVAARPAATDLKVKYKVSSMVGGQPQTSESTTMIKGARERNESHTGYGYDTVSILQCDKKQTIQLSETAKKYIITPIQSDETTADTGAAAANTPSGPTRKGGVVTYTTSAIDTGERKEMFGFTARHVKSSTTIESSPDACNAVKQRTEMDGWYIDLNVSLDCYLGRPPVMPASGARQTCKDVTRFRREGTGKVGYPLIETMKLYGDNGEVSYSTTKEVVELSREPLDMALFEIPAGYTEAATMQELYGMPSMESIMSGAAGQAANTEENTNRTPSNAGSKSAGTIRVGVVQINNKAGRPVSEDTLRERLVGQLQSTGIEAVPLNASSPSEAEPEAKVKQCDFILYTDVAALKVPKLGGFLGRVTGGDAGKTEAKIEFRLFAVGETSPRLQSTASAREDGDEASVGTAIDAEARMVSAEARRKGRS